MSSSQQLVEVALPLPVFQNFTYRLDGEFARPVVPGSRLLVPLRRGKEIGVCVATDVDAPSGKGGSSLKSVVDVPDDEPVISPDLLNLCRWISEYYIVPLGLCIRAALPAVLTGTTVLQPPRRTRRVVKVRDDIPSLLRRDKAFARAPQQRALFELLEKLGGAAPVEQLRSLLRFTPSVLRGLTGRGLVAVEEETVVRDPLMARPIPNLPRHSPTADQAAAIGAVLAGEPGSVFLLHGVTGSGKTLVYIEILRRVLASGGRGAIVLVPEISLTPQTVDRFRAAFGEQVAVLHSGLSDGERYDAWLSLRNGEKRIAVGARSAVFAPLENPGAIIVDEEHESSYKQGEAPRYHAREVAIVRARAAGGVVVLGSATPCLESWQNAESGKYRLLTLPARVGGASLPAAEVVDLRSNQVSLAVRPDADTPAAAPVQRRGWTAFSSVFSSRLEDELAANLESGDQSILLLNRRGHSSFLQCRECGDVISCPRCSISLTHHTVPEALVCHYCQHREPVSTECRRCGGEAVRHRGVGTQQVEKLLGERFPEARIARMDLDTTGAKWSHARILDRVAAGEVDILLGTQMIAKGLDFPGITLVGVVDADVGINLPDFRASERCFQLLSQVAGRAGRGPRGGRVIIQTRVPQHHAVRCALTHDYASFVAEELAGRREPGYPPFVRLANIVFSGVEEAATASLARAASAWIARLVARHGIETRALGPAPCPIERIKTRWRWHLLLKSESTGDMTRVLRYFLEHYRVPAQAQLRVAVDRDPVALL